MLSYVTINSPRYSHDCTSSSPSPSTNRTGYITNTFDSDCYIVSCNSQDIEVLPLLKEKPKFDRVMKVRNTDGRLFKPMVWRPIRG